MALCLLFLVLIFSLILLFAYTDGSLFSWHFSFVLEPMNILHITTFI